MRVVDRWRKPERANNVSLVLNVKELNHVRNEREYHEKV